MTSFSKKHLVIVRTGGSLLNLNSYNCQELGLAKALTRKGLKVTIIMAGEKHEKIIQKIGKKDIQIFLLPFTSLNQALSWFDNIEDLLKQLQPTLIQIHEFGMLMSWRVTKWAKKHHIPCFLIQGSYQPTQKPIFKQLEELFNQTFGKYILKNVDGIGCKTQMASNYIHQYCNRNTYPTYIGLDIEKFASHKIIEKNWKQDLNLQDKKVLLYVGVLEQRRNPLFLLNLLSILPNDYILLMVGDGPLLSNIKDEIKAKELDDRCILLGKQSQEYLPSIYNSSDLFLLASDYEIYGMVILEAMYFGLPVISTLTAGSETLIEPYENGVILNNKNDNDWQQIITAIMNDKTILFKMKEKSAAKIKNELIWDKACERFIQLYSGVK